MPAAKAEKEAWGDEHSAALLRAMICLVLEARPQLYATPSLTGVADNGGHRINQKLQRMLKKLCAMAPGAEQMVEEEVAALKNARSSGSGAKTPSPKKRKVKDELDDDH